MIVGVFMLFSINYLIDFLSKGLSADSYGSDFYFRHFWKYVAGGTIKVNQVVGNETVTYNAIDFITNNVFAYPNMFLRKFGLNVIKPIRDFGTAGGLTLVSNTARSNVISLLGQMYNSGAIFPFIGFTLLYGVVAQKCWDVVHFSRNLSKVLFAASILSFFLFSFFHNMWGGSIHPWELMIYAYILPLCFWKLTLYAKIKYNFE